MLDNPHPSARKYSTFYFRVLRLLVRVQSICRPRTGETFACLKNDLPADLEILIWACGDKSGFSSLKQSSNNRAAKELTPELMELREPLKMPTTIKPGTPTVKKIKSDWIFVIEILLISNSHLFSWCVEIFYRANGSISPLWKAVPSGRKKKSGLATLGRSSGSMRRKPFRSNKQRSSRRGSQVNSAIDTV